MRSSKTLSFRVADCHGYVTVGQYDDGRRGRSSSGVAEQGSTLAGIMDAVLQAVADGDAERRAAGGLVDMYTNMRFEPAGITDDAEIRFASSCGRLHPPPAGQGVPHGLTSGGPTHSHREERMQPTAGVEELTTPTSPGSDVYPTRPPPRPRAQLTNSPAASDAPYC